MEYYKVVLVAYQCRKLNCLNDSSQLCIERHDNYHKPSHAVSDESAVERRRRRKRKKIPGIQSFSDSGFQTYSESGATGRTTNRSKYNYSMHNIIDTRMERDWKRSALGKKRRVAFSLT